MRIPAFANPVERLIRGSTAPHNRSEFEEWLRLNDAIEFLKENDVEDTFVVYAAAHSTALNTVTVPNAALSPLDANDLLKWNMDASSVWGVSIGFGDSRTISLVPPLKHSGSAAVDRGEPIVFARQFDGRVGRATYLELLQKFSQVFDLHYDPDRNAYCRIDHNGDIQNVVVINEVEGKGSDCVVVSCPRQILDDYLNLTNAAMVRMFDFTRYKTSSFNGWSEKHRAVASGQQDLFYKRHVEEGHASYMQGVQVLHSRRTKEDLLKRFDFTRSEARQHASFLALDMKTGKSCEMSCEPGRTVNYFTESDLPYETSPAFFRPEVLLKYKADSEKYRFNNRSISCRGAGAYRRMTSMTRGRSRRTFAI